MKTHVNEIVNYLNSGPVIFPHAIILAMSTEVAFKKSRGPQVGDQDCLAGVLDIPVRPDNQKPAWIVDGQQRTLAIIKSNASEKLIPVTAFVSDDFEIYRTQFLLVNKAKPLPNSLINELLPEVNTTLPPSMAKKQIPSALCNLLNRDPESPFKGLIGRHTTDRKVNKTAVISDTSLLEVITKSLNNAHGCLYPYKISATGEVDIESIRKILNLYWGVVKELFPDAWVKPPEKSRLTHSAGITVMGILMDKVMGNISPHDKKAKEKIRKSLTPIVPYCAWTEGVWEAIDGRPWNGIQKTTTDVRLLREMLIQAYTQGLDQS